MSNANRGILGIDLGANSIGTALVDAEGQQVLFAGVRIFDPGVADLDTAKEKSLGAARREARLRRRQVDRRRRRLLRLWGILTRAGLMPAGERAEEIEKLDRQLYARYPDSETVPYLLRARGVTEKLELSELGRALYHLGQRRGFLSNRKGPQKDDEESGIVKKGIKDLEARLEGRTLGQYFASLNPHERRIRKHYTHRSMYLEEFERIWETQRAYWPEVLTGELKDEIHYAVFHQRPLKDQKDLVGACELMPPAKRAPMALLEVQRFRLLTAINNLRLVRPGEPERELTGAERAKAVEAAESDEKVTLAKLKKKTLKLGPDCYFTIERGDEKHIPGNLTACRMRKAMGKAWEEMAEDRRRELVAFLLDGPAVEEEMAAALRERFGLDQAEAEAAAAARLPDGYFSISLGAVRRMMPHLERGVTQAAARKIEFPEQFEAKPALDLLPPLQECGIEIRNPVVTRALTELRKTVNAIIRKYGKPEAIHVELARDLKKNREERLKDIQRNREREAEREQARQALSTQLGIPPELVKRSDIEKYLLWKECGCQCPYTGHSIGLEGLFGQNPIYQVEHIIPFSRCLDNSFQNKTLCFHELNAVKRNKTPWEAFGGTPDWEAMVDRVKKFGNPAKLRRFTMLEQDTEKLLEEFSSRQLNDTRYASRLAAQYLGLLYGGVTDAGGKRRVLTCAGEMTAILRREWEMNKILNKDSPGKSREDHRHHAVDAVTVAMCSQKQIGELSRLAGQAGSEGKRLFGRMVQEPWTGFKNAVEAVVDKVVVSPRPRYKLQGQMHDETFYSGMKRGPDGRTYIHKRVAVEDADPEQIVDARVREAVKAKLAAGATKRTLASDPPVLVTKGGKEVPIRRVRIRVSRQTAPETLGAGRGARNVLADALHHTAIVRNEEGKKVKFDHYPVKTLEAMRRKRAGEPVVRRDYGERCTLICTLRPGDVIEAAKTPGEKPELWRVRTVMSVGRLALHLLKDARTKKEITESGDLWSPTVNVAFSNGARKVRITHLGEVIPAHD